MRYLCYGGSFNPIHVGHLICARTALEQLGFDRVLLIPASQPPHKSEDTSVVSAPDRLAMCQRAVEGDPLFEVSDIELHRPGYSYTIDTARELRSRGWPEVHWLLGADMLNSLPQWHQPAALLAEVQFHLMARPGWSFDWATLPREYQFLQQQIVQTPLIDISSTDIRSRAASGRSIRYLTPPGVENYIREHQLYRPPGLD